MVSEDPDRLIEKHSPAFENLILLSSRSIKGFEIVSSLQDVSHNRGVSHS